MLRLYLLPFILIFFSTGAFCQQDVGFTINTHLLAGKQILKVKCDYYDPYVWVLAQNNQVFRINSQTMAVDDYTAQFSAYSNLQFIDIAGRSGDTVFVASNSTEVIEYNKGALRDIGLGGGITDPINSIGISNTFYYNTLLIGTSHGLGTYNFTQDVFKYIPYGPQPPYPVQIFSTTYRANVYTYDYFDQTLPNNYSLVFTLLYQGYSYFLHHISQTGNTINSAYAVPFGINTLTTDDGSFFWGNANGLFQENMGSITQPANAYSQFLNNIQVNKITDILGLASFYPAILPNISKDNLLVGTNNGLYYSSALNDKIVTGRYAGFSLFHFDPLGSLQINDVCVNATGHTYTDVPAGCEDGVWLGTADGVYLLTPDYVKYLPAGIRVSAIQLYDGPITDPLTTVNLCEGETLNAQIYGPYVDGNTVQWVKDGQNIPGATQVLLPITAGGEYYAILHNPCENISIPTNKLQVNIINSPVFTFDYPDKIQQCDNTPYTLQTTNNPGYSYRWYTNGVLNGNTSATYTANSSGRYKVEVSACTNGWVPSKEVRIEMINLPVPKITSDKTLYCAEDVALLSAKIALNANYTLNWYQDNNLLAADQNLTTINASAAGVYTAVITSNIANCSQTSAPFNLTFASGPVFTFNYPDKIQQCNNTPLTLQTTSNPGYKYRWYTNGVLNGNTTSSYTVTKTGKYKVEVSACTNSWVPSKEVEVDLVTLPVPQVTSDKMVYCAEDVATLTENAPADPSYIINWYRDGTLLTADNNLTTINETTSGSYTVTLASTVSTCTQQSAALPLAFTPAPVFTFNYPDQLQYCAGTALTLNVSGSPAYQYRWYKDGTLNGITTASLPVTQSGNYKVEVSSCAGSWVASKEVQVNFVKVPVPAISTDKPVYCIGDNATLSLSKSVDPDYTIQWYKDNVPVPNSTGQSSIVTNVPGNYTVALAYSTPNSNGSTCSQMSAAQVISFNTLPTVTIQKTVNTTICDGQTINLKANYNGGTVQWSTGETTGQLNVTKAGTYTATITSTAGCQATASMDVTFLPNPVFSVNDTSICTYKKQVVTLYAPAGFAQYAWNGQTGNQTYQVSQPQTVSLTVTDINGCQATQQIKVADQCPDIYIPNTFTPNGDGINDTWVIEGLDNDPSSTVKVFTRNGVRIFESIGYGSTWNGEYKGKKLPAGAYYYIVTARKGAQKFSGSLTIIY